ncbi:FAD-dependent oxidoreductase [Paraburkholderia sp. CNPSo 3076]|uniref:NAD(P)/FAD-dependent oxidoreductase n=1 Tax=Paraburkholderia sp. CNPSo 3076 TaxID=2940936 RepID=UPI002258114A|nr:FAD-dependent oxidoreductase [Paraburkholderia sp. CNPSo 3076]MCX5542106.1 FAD-dependent oxidoreductase [Paraburkholderia sp. CNPSo 3076]
MADSIIIIGGGVAGVSAAEELRKCGFNGNLTILNEERELPYDRPPLSKSYASGVLDEEELLLRPPEWYEDHKVRLCHERAARLLPHHRSIELAGGGLLRYDLLLLATGARARTPAGFESSSRILTLRNLADARRFRALLHHGQRLHLVGGGVIGMECAATAALAGCQVTVLEAGERIMERFVPPVISDVLATTHRRNAVTIRERFRVGSIAGNESGVVITGSGEVIETDWVLLGMGAKAEIGLAQAAGIAIEVGGIKVDGEGRTSEPGIFATGDCAAFPGPDGGKLIRWENWTHARDHARSVARAMLGDTCSYNGICWVWSNQYDFNVQVTGQSNAETVLLRGDQHQGPLTTLHLEGNRIVGAATVNNPHDKRALHQLVRARATISREILEDSSIPLSEIVRTLQ